MTQHSLQPTTAKLWPGGPALRYISTCTAWQSCPRKCCRACWISLVFSESSRKALVLFYIGLYASGAACDGGSHGYGESVLSAAGSRLLRYGRASYTLRMEIHFSAEQEARLRDIATQTGRGADEVVKEFVQTQLDHDTWFRTEVEVGLQQLDRGEYVTHEEVLRRMAPHLKGE